MRKATFLSITDAAAGLSPGDPAVKALWKYKAPLEVEVLKVVVVVGVGGRGGRGADR